MISVCKEHMKKVCLYSIVRMCSSLINMNVANAVFVNNEHLINFLFLALL